MRLANQQPLVNEDLAGLPQRVAGNAEGGGELLFDELGAGPEPPAHDALTQNVGDPLSGGLPVQQLGVATDDPEPRPSGSSVALRQRPAPRHAALSPSVSGNVPRSVRRISEC